MDLTILLVFALGFLSSATSFGLWLAWTRVRTERLRGLNAQLAQFWPDELPSRSAVDVIAGRVRVILGGQMYELPVLPLAASDRWLRSLDEQFAELAAGLDAAGNDTPRILELLAGQPDLLYKMLQSYDRTGVLPPRDEINETATAIEILRAALEVWRAAHPLASTLVERMDERTPADSAASPSVSQPLTVGVPITSGRS
jgi:hypothetical protein